MPCGSIAPQRQAQRLRHNKVRNRRRPRGPHAQQVNRLCQAALVLPRHDFESIRMLKRKGLEGVQISPAFSAILETAVDDRRMHRDRRRGAVDGVRH
jgi:hypothetical protein